VALIAVTIGSVAPLVAAVVLLFIEGGPRVALDLVDPFFDHPTYLLLILGINLGLLGFRFAAAADAFNLSGGGFSTSRRSVVAALMVSATLGILVVAPHLWAAQRNLALYDLLSYDYTLDTDQVAVPPTLPPQPTVITATTTTSASTTSTPPPASTPPSPPTTQVRPPALRVNVLLLGGDAGPDRPGLRTDTIIVASIDPETGRTVLLQLPRNQVDLPIPPDHPAYDVWECHCYPELANTIYQYGLQHPELFPGGANSGATAVMDLVGHLYDIQIHNYALVDLLGFVAVIDALGGLTITVTSAVEDEQYTRPGGDEIPVEYRPGTYEMDGEEVLAFARVRRGTDDYHRMGRQRCVLEALATQSDAFTLLRVLPWLVPAIQGSVLTDIPIRDWPDFIELLDVVDPTALVSVRFMPRAPELVGTGTSYAIKNPQGYWIPNVELIRSTVASLLTGGPTTEDLGIPLLGEVCGTSE
jgi:LCP family protein required for cell wall assembly